MWFTSKAELQKESDSKFGWKCFLELVVLTCSVTGALGAAECQVAKWDMDGTEVKVRPEERTGRQARKTQNQASQGKINSLSLVFIPGILQMSQLWGLNLKHIFMGSWAGVSWLAAESNGTWSFPVLLLSLSLPHASETATSSPWHSWSSLNTLRQQKTIQWFGFVFFF